VTNRKGQASAIKLAR